MKEESRGGGSELGSDPDLDPDQANYADPLDPDPQYCFIVPFTPFNF